MTPAPHRPAPAELASSVQVRDANKDDLPFILDTWMKTYRTSDYARRVEGGLYFEGQQRRVYRLLGRCDARVIVDPEEPTSILGYIVHELRDDELVVHWAYVRPAFRKFGLLRLLIATAPRHVALTYSHQTDKARQVGRALKAAFNPYAIEEQ